jgi:hypothetical protein
MAQTDKKICYTGGTVEVLPGDHVELRVWFRRRSGRVVYVPGISPFNGHYEHNGLQWVAVRSKNMLIGTIVDSVSGDLKEKVKFLRRDESLFEALPNEQELDKHGGGWSP